MTLAEIAKYRLANQQLADSKFTSCIDLMKWMVAIQAQEYGPSKWSLGLRVPDLTDADVEKHFTIGEILRTHLLRPTWHFVAPEDLRWLLQLTAPKVNAVNGTMYRKLELDEKRLVQCIDVITKVLEGGKQLTREAIKAAFQKNKIKAEGHRLSYIMMYAELAGIICSGPRQGNQFTYTLLEDRVPKSRVLDQEDALADLTKRYFLSRGPASLKDFSTWSGLTLRECKKGLEITNPLFSKETVDGQDYYYNKQSSNVKTDNHIHLLSIYDEFIMGYIDRSSLMQFRSSLKAAPPFQFDSMIVHEGQIIGTWKRKILKTSIDLDLQLFKPLQKNQGTALDDAIRAFGVFTNMKVNYK